MLDAERIFFAIGQYPADDLGAQLGCRRDAGGHIVVDKHYRTSVAHVYAAGDIVPGSQLAIAAASDGAIAAQAAAPATQASKHPAPTLPHRPVRKVSIKGLLLVLILGQESWHWRLLLCCGSGCAKKRRTSWPLESILNSATAIGLAA